MKQMVHTLSSVTGDGHVKYKRNSLACKIPGKLALLMVLHRSVVHGLSYAEHMYFIWPVIRLFSHGIELLQNMPTGSVKVKKRLVMYFT